MLNCGVFALHADAPHWEAWRRLIAQVLQRTRFFYAEQIALNYGVFAERLPVELLPAYCNWLPATRRRRSTRRAACLSNPICRTS